jgi:hypothetical protein
MKKLLMYLVVISIPVIIFAQSPQKISYQCVVRNSSDALVNNHTIGMKISILQGTATGTAVYVETHTSTTNANGLVTIEIGGGTAITGTFSTINWANGPYFLKTETDPSGGTSYSITGTSQLLSVPYALYAKTAEDISGSITETDPVFVASSANGITSTNITNWNTAYGWGDHTGLYKSISYVPAWGEITSIPTGFADGVDNIDDADNSITNEIQTISINGSNLTLSQGGGTVVIPGDNWGNQTAVADATLSGNGTTATPLRIADNGITSAKILDGTIASADLADNSVTSVKVSDGTIVNADIANDAINSSKILDASVAAADIATSAVTTAKIADNAITVVKLPAGAAADKYLRGDGTWETPTAGILTETDPTWNGDANETGDIGRTGKVGIGTNNPSAMLHIQGKGTGEGNVVFVGEGKGSPGNPPVSGSGTRMMWYPHKAAFRVGDVEGAHWDAANIGYASVAMGINTTASNDFSTAMGYGTTASGGSSTAIGYNTIASGGASFAMGDNTTAMGDISTAMGYKTIASANSSIAMGSSTTASGEASVAMGIQTIASKQVATAMGNSTTASGETSTAMGFTTIASGDASTTMGSYTNASGNASTAMGYQTIASGDASTAMGLSTAATANISTAIGAFNVGGGDATTWIATDPLFEVGNGVSNTSRHNAVTVLKNGNVGIGTTTPTGVLNISGNSNPAFPQLLLTEDENDFTRLMFKNTATSSKNWTIAGYTYPSDNLSYLNFYYDNGIAGANLITIVGDGNVGIGTPYPNYKLDVRGTIGNNTTLYHSDIRWKADIKHIKYGINELMKLNSISYLWKVNDYPEMGFDKGDQFGFIAQEFEKIIPELVRTDNDGYKSIDYVKLIPVLVEAIQEQQGQIESTKQENEHLKSQLQSLQERIEKTETILAKNGEN